MNTTLTFKHVSELDSATKRELSRLSFRGRGALAKALYGKPTTAVDTRCTDRWVYVLRDTDNKVISWAMVRKVGLATWPKDLRYYDFMIYTRASERRKGYGTQLFNLAREQFGNKLRVYRHDPRSSEFYDNLGAKLPRRNVKTVLH